MYREGVVVTHYRALLKKHSENNDNRDAAKTPFSIHKQLKQTVYSTPLSYS